MDENEFEIEGVTYISVDCPPVKPCQRCDLFINERCENSSDFHCFADFRNDNAHKIFKEKQQ